MPDTTHTIDGPIDFLDLAQILCTEGAYYEFPQDSLSIRFEIAHQFTTAVIF